MAAELSTTQIALLEAIKASLFGTDPNYPTDTDWTEVVKEAKPQTVLGIISPIIPVKDVSVEMGKATYMRLLFEQDKLIKLLDANDIPCVILKGSAAAQYYPKPHLRAMGDVDFLVPKDMFETDIMLLESKGYEYHHGKTKDGKIPEDVRHIGYVKNGIEFELHHHFSSYGFNIDDIIELAIYKKEYRNIDGYNIPVLPDFENGLVLLGHINQHLISQNLGLRQIIDWSIYIHTEIYEFIKSKGYIGSVAAIRMFMQKERAHAKRLGLHGGKDYIHRITLSQLVYRNLEDVKLITQDQYEALLKQYPELAALYGILRDLHRIVFSKKAEDLEHWIEQASHLDAVPELKSFVDGLKHDIFAIKNAIMFDYNNGLAEGSVTKIKLIKRIMYGRNSFAMLKAKVLMHELLYANSN